MTRKSLDDLGQLQRAVMETVWELGETTVADVRQRLSRKKKLAYTTILSAMQKLEKAGWLRHRVQGRTYVYMPRESREQVGSKSLRKFIDRVFWGDPLQLFQHLVEDETLGEDDLVELKKMIERRRKELRDG